MFYLFSSNFYKYILVFFSNYLLFSSLFLILKYLGREFISQVDVEVNANEENKENANNSSGQGVPNQVNQLSHEQANSDRVLASASK